MASLFASKDSIDCRLLDAGAGIGSLTSAFLERCTADELSFSKIEVTAFELDSLIHEELNSTLASYTSRLPVAYKIIEGDFIEQAVSNVNFDDRDSRSERLRQRGFTHAILNPPYQKINSKSRHRLLLRQAGIETVNLYSAFVALALMMMAPGGWAVAIVPRSFCNGPYYRPFRDFILERAAIQHIHLFDYFRLKSHLRKLSESGTVPLLYPAHFTDRNIEWPKPNIKKPNAIDRNAETEKWLYPNGFYCLVRRFSSKEEKRRIVANVLQPSTFGDVEMLGLENHLNVYHENKHGLPEALARGLAVYLNTTSVDRNFRRSSGHTQVNATDLKMMKYPSRKALIGLGEWAMRCGEMTQQKIDDRLANLTA